MPVPEDQNTPTPAQTPDPSQASTPQQQPQPSAPQPTQNAQSVATSEPSTPAQVQVPAPAQATPASDDTHPSVQRAGIVRQIAEALAGGTRYKTTIDPSTGAATRTEIPMSKTDIGMAIALEALSGGLKGLAATGPGHLGQAAAIGVQNGVQIGQQRQAAQQQQEQQAEADAERQSQAIMRAAQLHEINSRTLLNTSEAEAQGADAIDKLTTINRSSGVLDVDPIALENNGQPMTQAELMDGMKSGAINGTSHLGPVAGRVETTDANGNQRWASTHLVVKDPSTPITLTQELFDSYAAAQVPGFPAGTKIAPSGVPVKLSTVQRANEIAGAHTLANGRLDDLRTLLKGTPYAAQVPASLDYSKAGVETSMERFAKYVSHNADNLGDPYLALQAMGADRRNPTTGQMEPNPDAKYVDGVANTLGGWPLLEAAHNQQAVNKADQEKYSVIDTQDKAEAVLAAPKRFTPDQRTAAQRFVSLSESQGIGKAVAEARAHAHATGADVEAMWRFGTNPITGEKLTLDNAPDAALVSPSGTVVPQNLVSLYKPTAQEKQTADTARQVLAISQGLQQQVAKNPALIGPLAGRDKQALSKLGLGDAQAQKLLDDVSLLQSAVTKMHTGRFSNEILKKSGALIFPGMNGDEFNGAISSIQDVAQRYANEDQLRSVADYKQQNRQNSQPQVQPSTRSVQIPVGAQIGRDAHGNAVGYKLNGVYHPLGGQ